MRTKYCHKFTICKIPMDTALLHSSILVLEHDNIVVVQQILKRQVGQRRQRRRRNDLVVALLVPEPERPAGGLDVESGGGGSGNRVFLLWHQVSRILHNCSSVIDQDTKLTTDITGRISLSPSGHPRRPTPARRARLPRAARGAAPATAPR